MVDVFEIEPHHLIKVRDIGSPADLPHAGESGGHADASPVVFVVLLKLLFRRRHGTKKHQGIEFQDLPGFAEEFPLEEIMIPVQEEIIGKTEENEKNQQLIRLQTMQVGFPAAVAER